MRIDTVVVSFIHGLNYLNEIEHGQRQSVVHHRHIFGETIENPTLATKGTIRAGAGETLPLTDGIHVEEMDGTSNDPVKHPTSIQEDATEIAQQP